MGGGGVHSEIMGFKGKRGKITGFKEKVGKPEEKTGTGSMRVDGHRRRL